jgi:hypothetical protein
LGYEAFGFIYDPSWLLCGGRRYFPRSIHCRDGLVTEVLCGTLYEVGDAFP